MRNPDRLPPGTAKPRRFRPTFHYELLVCGLAGHELLALDRGGTRGAVEANVRQSNTNTSRVWSARRTLRGAATDNI